MRLLTEPAAAGACALAAAGFAVLGVIELADDVWSLGGQVWPALGGSVAAGGVLVVLALVSRRMVGGATSAARARTVTFHSSGGQSLWATRMHEAGHVVMTRRLGGEVKRVEVNSDGSGLTVSTFPPWVDLSGVDEAAMDYAGGYAEGSWIGAGSDLNHARAALHGYGWRHRGWADRHARRFARGTVGPGLLGPRASVVRVARGLPAPGTRRFRR